MSQQMAGSGKGVSLNRTPRVADWIAGCGLANLIHEDRSKISETSVHHAQV
jgi:hypothetical protein